MESIEKWDLFVAGDDDAYTWIYTTYVQDLYRFGLCFTTDTELVKDCIQDLFTSIYSHRKTISRPNSLKAYLFVSLKHNLVHAITVSRKSIDEISETTIPFLQEDTVEDIFIMKESTEEEIKLVKNILAVLSPRQKEAIFYRYIQELSISEISQIMSMNYQSTQNLIRRGFDKIRSMFPESLPVLVYMVKVFQTISMPQ